MITETWTPAGQRYLAIDSASDRCAALAGAKAVVRGTPRREAVAPMKTMLPAFFAFIAATTSFDTRNAPERVHAPRRLEVGRADLLDVAPHARARVVDENVDVAELLADRREGLRHRRGARARRTRTRASPEASPRARR